MHVRPQSPSLAVPPAERAGTVYLIGVDSMTREVIDALSARGELPNLARIAAEGCKGLLTTIRPNHSSLVWASIATGLHYRDHGIDADGYNSLLGLRVRRSTTHKLNKVGLKVLLRILRATGMMHKRSYDRRDLCARTIWEIVSDCGGTAGVVNWCNSWPAFEVNGFAVSDGLQPWRQVAFGVSKARTDRLTFPAELYEQIAPLVVLPEHVSLDEMKRYVNLPEGELKALLTLELKKRDVRSELRYVIASNLTAVRAFECCLDHFPRPNLAALLFWAMDKVQHAAYQYMPFAEAPGVTEEERSKFGGVVPEAYRFVDRTIGKVLARMAAEDSLLVISDHGFAYEPRRGTYGHKRLCPPGVFYAWGSKLRRGHRIENASVYDIAPTVLRLCGLPPSAQMRGRCLEAALAPEFARDHPPQDAVPSYG